MNLVLALAFPSFPGSVGNPEHRWITPGFRTGPNLPMGGHPNAMAEALGQRIRKE